MIFLYIMIIGFFAAFIGSIAGLGGGMIFIPALLFLSQFYQEFSWVNPQTVVGMSLVVMVITGLSSTLTYMKQKTVDIQTGLLFLLAGIPGSLSGVWVNRFMAGETFYVYFGLLMIVISFMFTVRKKITDRHQMNKNKGFQRTFYVKGERYIYSYSLLPAMMIAFLVGFVSGLFGIGGGSLMVPAMVMIFGIPIHISVATAMFMILVSSFIGALAHLSLGHVIWEYALFFLPGAWIGGVAGAKTNQKLQGDTIERIFRVLLILIGVRLIWNGLM
ncbi:MAG: sulfite exporter TauE/SafE family protein [Bacillaceae bacterium]|nr:sulfite exporter TauE/SafE family protein [Bacillaceae bacterium]